MVFRQGCTVIEGVVPLFERYSRIPAPFKRAGIAVAGERDVLGLERDPFAKHACPGKFEGFGTLKFYYCLVRPAVGGYRIHCRKARDRDDDQDRCKSESSESRSASISLGGSH